MTHRSLITGIVALCLAVTAAGQGQIRDFHYSTAANPLLTFNNAAGLASLEYTHYSEAGLSFQKENGAIIPVEDSPDSWTAGIQSQSYRRVSDKLVFSGKLEYSYFRGQNMGGQILMNPRDNALNFLEEDAATAGVKQRERYELQGGMSYSLNRTTNLGLKIDYTSADQTKLKDPRFLNVLMHLDVAPGIMFTTVTGNYFGGNLIYRHSIEQLSSGLFGSVDRDYFIYVDQGGFWGAREVFTGDMGYVSKDNVRPLTDDRYGLSLQMATGRKIRFSGQFTGLWRNGYYGSRTSSSVVFCEFRGPEAKFNGILLMPSADNMHRVEIVAGAKYLSKLTNSYTYKSEAGMSTVVEYHGQNETMTRTDIDAGVAYFFQKNVSHFRPDWVFGASADAFMRNQKTVLYPEYRHHDHMNISLDLSAERNINKPSDCITIAASLLFFTGGGTAKEDGTYASGTSKLKSFDNWLYPQFEYDTLSRAGGEVSFAWIWLRFKNISPYVKVSDKFMTLLSTPQYLSGRSRNVALVTVGCNF